jgi:SAM-dependent MidA family methyltransferase
MDFKFRKSSLGDSMLNIIIEKIKQSSTKLISYADYIELALYHKTQGYYMKNQIKIGRDGDFITTSNVSDIFGSLVSKWFLYLVTEHRIFPSVCEIGAGNGRFAKAFNDTWRRNTDIPLQYYIVETSPYHRSLQKEILPIGDNILQVDKLSDIRPFKGLIFSNELFDALPVHVIEKKHGQLFEVMIGTDGSTLREEYISLTNPNIYDYLKNQKLELADDQRIEIPLSMEDVIKDISVTLENGLVVTVDYGYTNQEWKNPLRRSGSLRGYYKHQMVTDVLLHPGEMDLTHHVHFDSLVNIGQRYDLDFLLKNRQDEFLISTGILKELEENYDPNPFSEKSKRNRAIRSLVMPGMSSHFDVVVQHKKSDVSIHNLFAK